MDVLVGHKITHMEDPTNHWPTLDIPKAELRQRLVIFKRRAFLLLYRLVGDSVIRIKDILSQKHETLTIY